MNDFLNYQGRVLLSGMTCAEAEKITVIAGQLAVAVWGANGEALDVGASER